MKKRIFSGIQPSGNLHLGNYLGAIKNWVALQDEPASTREDDCSSTRGGYELIFCVVDMHAITVPQDPETLRKKTIEVAKIYLASGIDPQKSSIFIQSHVSEHAELMWVLNTITTTSDLFKMTQFKDKSGVTLFKDQVRQLLLKNKTKDSILLSAKNEEDINYWIKRFTEGSITYVGTGLFTYPVLMAADILLYDTNLVPVGEDQTQHVEFSRKLADKFNNKFGDTFIMPEPHIQKEGMRIMGLDDPTKKMSKSAASEYNYIALTDDPEYAKKKIMKAVTDSGAEIVYSDEKPAIKNLINIYSLLDNKTPKEIEKMYVGKGPASTRGDDRSSTRGGYGEFKKDLAEVVAKFLTEFQAKYNAISDDDVLQILREGAQRVRPLAKAKMDEVKNKVGFIL